ESVQGRRSGLDACGHSADRSELVGVLPPACAGRKTVKLEGLQARATGRFLPLRMIMPFPSFLPHPAGLALRALDALLRREDWARHRLTTHAGKTLRLSLGRLGALQATISSDG